MQLIVTALDSEARPLLDQYRLRASANSGPFRLYGNDNILLIVSGIGRVNAAAASAYLAALAGPGVHSWLNIGIGGQRDYVLGSAWLASCICFSVKGRRNPAGSISDASTVVAVRGRCCASCRTA